LESVFVAWEEWDLEVEPERKREMRQKFEAAVQDFIQEKNLLDAASRRMSIHDFRFFAREIYSNWRAASASDLQVPHFRARRMNSPLRSIRSRPFHHFRNAKTQETHD
jgi:hypothetical protein